MRTSCLPLVFALACASAQAVQTETLTFTAGSVVSRAAFDFGTSKPWIDAYTPAQTGVASSALFNNHSGVQALLGFSPTATASFSYDPGGFSAINDNGVLFNYFATPSMTVTLPGGTGAGAKVFANSTTGLQVAGLADGARLEPTGDVVMLPGTADIATIGMVGPFLGSGLTVSNGPATATKIDLLADPFFRTTYNGRVALPNLANLVVTLAQPTLLTLSTPSLAFLDETGTALTGSAPPATLPLAGFAEPALSMPFQGNMRLTLDRADYASSADHTTAVNWLAASGFRGVILSQVAVWTPLAAVPEPSAAVLLLAGLGLFVPLARRSRRGAAAALAVAAGAASGPAAATDYSYTTLLPDGYASVQVWDVNNQGVVAGTASTATISRGFIWKNGVYTWLAGPAGALDTGAFAMSENGLVVGNYSTQVGIDPGTGAPIIANRAYVFDGTHYTTLFRGSTPVGEVRGISPDGRWLSTWNDGVHGTYVLDLQTGAALDLPASAGIPQGINAAWQLVGSTAGSSTTRSGFIFDIASATFTATSWAGRAGTSFRDIDNSGRIAGWGVGRNPETGVSTTVGIVGPLSAPEVVMVPHSSTTFVQGINDAGWLSGNYTGASGVEVGFVAIPVPEPAIWALWLGGGLLLAAARPRRRRQAI